MDIGQNPLQKLDSWLSVDVVREVFARTSEVFKKKCKYKAFSNILKYYEPLDDFPITDAVINLVTDVVRKEVTFPAKDLLMDLVTDSVTVVAQASCLDQAQAFSCSDFCNLYSFYVVLFTISEHDLNKVSMRYLIKTRNVWLRIRLLLQNQSKLKIK